MSVESWSEDGPVRIAFGPGKVEELGDIVSGNTLIVTTHGAVERGLTDRVAGLVGGSARVDDSVRSNPTIDDIDSALARNSDVAFDWIVGLGGGSAIDVAKVLSVGLAARPRAGATWFPADAGWIDVEPIPAVAIPTTAGTGSEVTPFATVWDATTKLKHSFGTPRMHPKVALVDPELTATLPWDVTLSTGLDAYSQCFEAILNRRQTAETTAIALRGLALVPDALRELQRDPGSVRARTAMSETALRSGLAISVTRTGLAHSMSYPLTAHLGVPHGLACAVCLLPVMRFTAEVDDRVDELARRLDLDDASGLLAAVDRLFEDLGVRDAARAIIGAASLQPLAREMFSPERADNNLRATGGGDIQRLVHEIEDWLGEDAA